MAVRLSRLCGRLMAAVSLPVLVMVFGFGMLLLGRNCLAWNAAVGLSRLCGRLMAAVSLPVLMMVFGFGMLLLERNCLA